MCFFQRPRPAGYEKSKNRPTLMCLEQCFYWPRLPLFFWFVVFSFNFVLWPETQIIQKKIQPNLSLDSWV
jgi:hypothetical protein